MIYRHKRGKFAPELSNDLLVLKTIERWVHRTQSKSCLQKEAYFSYLQESRKNFKGLKKKIGYSTNICFFRPVIPLVLNANNKSQNQQRKSALPFLTIPKGKKGMGKSCEITEVQQTV